MAEVVFIHDVTPQSADRAVCIGQLYREARPPYGAFRVVQIIAPAGGSAHARLQAENGGARAVLVSCAALREGTAYRLAS